MKLQQRLSPQMVMLQRLLEIPTTDLERRIREEVEENPVLETEERLISVPNYRLFNSSNEGNYIKEQVFAQSLSSYLNEQLQSLHIEERLKSVAQYIIGSIDPKGFLERDEEHLIDDIAINLSLLVTFDEVREAITLVQQLDPVGVASRSLQEYLAIQLKDEEGETAELALEIVETQFNYLSNNAISNIKKRVELSGDEVDDAIALIRSLTPYPAINFTADIEGDAIAIIPDFIADIEGENLVISLNKSNIPDLQIREEYLSMAEGDSKSRQMSEAVEFAKKRIAAANIFIEAIKQRDETLMLVMNCIATIQREFLLTGDKTYLKPMRLKDIATAIERDISTVSRATNGKHIETPWGNISLKSLFIGSIKGENDEEISTDKIKDIIADRIDNEDREWPINDDQLTSILNEMGYKIARRTVAKYREELGIAIARKRKI